MTTTITTNAVVSYLMGVNKTPESQVTEALCTLAIEVASFDVVLCFSYLLLCAFVGSVFRRYLRFASWLFWLVGSAAVAVYGAALTAQHTEVVSLPSERFFNLLREKGLESSAIVEVAAYLVLTTLSGTGFHFFFIGDILHQSALALRFYLFAALAAAVYLSVVSDVVLVEEITFDEREFLTYLSVAFVALAVTPVVIIHIARSAFLLRATDDEKKAK